MEDQQRELTDEMVKFAESEPHFQTERLTEELTPLLDEYFIGNYQAKGNAIDIFFPNGQHFKLTIGEII